MARLLGGLAAVILSLLLVVGLALWAIGNAIWSGGGVPGLVAGVALLIVGFPLAIISADLLSRRNPTWRRAEAAMSAHRRSRVLPGFGASDGIRDLGVTLVAARPGLVLRWDDGTEDVAPWSRVVEVTAVDSTVGARAAAMVDVVIAHESDGSTRRFRIQPDNDLPSLAILFGFAGPVASPWEFEEAARTRRDAARPSVVPLPD